MLVFIRFFRSKNKGSDRDLRKKARLDLLLFFSLEKIRAPSGHIHISRISTAGEKKRDFMATNFIASLCKDQFRLPPALPLSSDSILDLWIRPSGFVRTQTGVKGRERERERENKSASPIIARENVTRNMTRK